MSGYNPKTGVFELTSSKIGRWHKRTEYPQGFNSKYHPLLHMDFFVDLFRFFGVEIIKNGGNYLHVKANPEKVWEILSGKASIPDKANYYYRNHAP